MTEQELRQLVREVIAQHLGPAAHLPSGSATQPALPPAPPPLLQPHPSHGVFQVLRSGDATTGCLIEPSVRCAHCSYCKTYGH